MTWGVARAALPREAGVQGSLHPRDTQPTEPQGLTTSSVLIAVAVVGLILVAGVLAWALYRRYSYLCRTADEEAAVAAASRRARVDAARAALAAKRRESLAKLDLIAPAQALQECRTNESESCVKGLVSVSTKIVCAICLDVIESEELVRDLPCTHVFHAPCLNLWIEKAHQDCPLCKFNLFGSGEKQSSESTLAGDADCPEVARLPQIPPPAHFPNVTI